MKKADAALQRRIRDQGCIVCLNWLKVHNDGDIHHCLAGGRRAGEDKVICLCPTHHRSGQNTKDYVSRHPWRREFARRYGTDQELFELTMERLT